MDKNTPEELAARLNQLEYQAAFQEQTIESLNAALGQQQLLISKMQEQIRYLVGKMKHLDTEQVSPPAQEPLPPHY